MDFTTRPRERGTTPVVALLVDIAMRASAHDSAEAMVRDVFERVTAHLDTDLFINYLASEDEAELRLAAFAGLTDEQVAPIRTLRLNQAVCGTVAAVRHAIVVTDVQNSPDPMATAVRPLGVRTYACHPLLGVRGRLVGTLSFGSRDRDAFNDDELELMQAVANHVAVAIERTQALDDARRELQERKDTEEALRESEAKLRRERAFLRTVIDSVTSMVMIRDAHGRCVLANESAARFHGMTVSALEGRDCHDLPTIPSEFLRLDQAALGTGRETTVEMEARGADGNLHALIASRTPLVAADGRPDRVLATAVDITWRKRVEEALRENQERLRLALTAAEGGTYVFDVERGVLYMSPEAATVYGLPPGSQSLSKEEALGLMPPEDREKVEAALRRAVETGVYQVEYRLREAGGSVRALASYARFHDHGRRLVGFVMNITERKRAEASLRESEEKFAKAFRGNAAGMAMTRLRDGIVLDMNDAFARMSGYQRDELVGKPMGAVWRSGEDRAAFVRLLQRDGEVQNLEAHGVRRNGEPWTALISAQVLTVGGEPTIITSLVDITDRKRAEEALREANQRLADADRRKDDFIAILSHELRNPLAPIRYALPLIQREALTAPAGRAAAVIDRQVDHLTRLVDDLLDISRITRGKVELRREYVALDAVIGAAVEAASPVIGAARHVLKTTVSNESVWLYVDAARVSQVVTNLLNNSAKYTPRGGCIVLQAGREDGHAVIRVRDNGMGIPSDALPTIFEMFRQVDRPDTTQGGLGIGLALVKSLVAMHGGTIEAQSAGIGQGSEFIVRLPVAEERKPETVASEEGPSRATARRLKVLVVDDNADLVEMLAMLVEAAGHDVRKALDGRSAVSAALSYRPDLILLDLGLPVMSGLEVARELGRHSEMAGTRLVALTGWGQAEDRRQTQDAGFDGHLTKPTDPRQLERLLSEFARAAAGQDPRTEG